MTNRLFASLLALLVTCSTWAQTKVQGEVSALGRVGYSNPYDFSARLNISTPKLQISPFFGVKGINRQNSEMEEDVQFTYTGISPLSDNADFLYESHQKTQTDGMKMEYGTTFIYLLSPLDLLTASVKGDYEHRHLRSLQQENVYMPLQHPFSLSAGSRSPHSMVGSEWQNRNNEQTLDVSADYTHIFLDPLDMPTWLIGSQLDIKYNYLRESEDADNMQDILPEKTIYHIPNSYHLLTDGLTQKHRIQADYQIPLLITLVPLNIGAFYENRLIRSNDGQWLENNQALDDHFTHRYQTIGTYLKGSLGVGSVKLNAKLEYNYTRMEDENLNDFVPEFGASWQMNKSNSLVFNYVRRIVRPSLALLNPAKVRGPYTISYGNPDLIGMHANSFILKYLLKHDKVDFTTTLQHIAANDGFNAIWMERDLVRISTWGNEGKRRAWSMTPEVVWRPFKQTNFQAKATLIWDKREAEAIHMAKEHWGISASARLSQQLPLDIRMQIYCDYSEGNTIDLYSHQGRQLGYGAELQRKLTNNGKLVAAIGYDHIDEPDIILTQGAYVGTIHNSFTHEDSGWLRLTYKF